MSDAIEPPFDSDEVPPRPQTDEEFAALPILDLSDPVEPPCDTGWSRCGPQ